VILDVHSFLILIWKAFIGLMLHIFFLNLKSCPTLAVTSASLFGTSLLGSTILIHKYDRLLGISATQAMDYLESIQSPTFKFQFIALTFALPHTLHLWGMLAFTANCLFMVATYFGTGFAAGISVVGLLAVLVLQWTTSERFNASLAGLQAKLSFSRNNQDECMV